MNRNTILIYEKHPKHTQTSMSSDLMHKCRNVVPTVTVNSPLSEKKKMK